MLVFSTLLSEGLKGIHCKVYPAYRNNLKDVSAYIKRYPKDPKTFKNEVQVVKLLAKAHSKLEQKKDESEFDGIIQS